MERREASQSVRYESASVSSRDVLYNKAVVAFWRSSGGDDDDVNDCRKSGRWSVFALARMSASWLFYFQTRREAFEG